MRNFLQRATFVVAVLLGALAVSSTYAQHAFSLGYHTEPLDAHNLNWHSSRNLQALVPEASAEDEQCSQIRVQELLGSV